jgi:hypothetical protein
LIPEKFEILKSISASALLGFYMWRGEYEKVGRSLLMSLTCEGILHKE